MRWDSEAERKLIDVWADILGEFSGLMMTQLNMYLSKELNRTNKYIEEEVCNKLDTIMKKGKSMYVNNQQKGETGKGYTQDDANIDIEVAKIAWQNFKTFSNSLKITLH